MLKRAVAFMSAIIVFAAGPAVSSTYLDIEKDDKAYWILNRLEAEGVIRSSLLSRRPISRNEAQRLLHEAEINADGKGPFLNGLVRSLRDLLGEDPRLATVIRPLDTVEATYAYSNTERQDLNYNNNGDRYARGSNVRTGFTSRIDDAGPFSFMINPEYRHPDMANDEKNNIVAKKAYAVVDFGWDLVIGKDSQWWGPGHHGAVLLTDNAEPFTMIKITNPSPITLPWIFKHLGAFGFTFFVTNLEKARPVPEPHLYGIRLDFKPSPYIEIGLEKTAILGGKGRPDDLKTWFDSLTGNSHGGYDYSSPTYTNIDDQRAGFDIKITIPWHVQPMQLYVEADGEDVSSSIPAPLRWAFLAGLYLPKILDAERFDLRLEYATTRGDSNNPYVWYTHNIYTSYTYKGDLIGHHVGTASSDWFLETSYFIPEKNYRMFLAYDHEEHNLNVPGDHEKKTELIAGFSVSLEKRTSVTAQYSRGWIKNPGNVAGPTIQESLASTRVIYEF